MAVCAYFSRLTSRRVSLLSQTLTEPRPPSPAPALPSEITGEGEPSTDQPEGTLPNRARRQPTSPTGQNGGQNEGKSAHMNTFLTPRGPGRHSPRHQWLHHRRPSPRHRRPPHRPAPSADTDSFIANIAKIYFAPASNYWSGQHQLLIAGQRLRQPRSHALAPTAGESKGF